jgi:hypothetical protein
MWCGRAHNHAHIALSVAAHRQIGSNSGSGASLLATLNNNRPPGNVAERFRSAEDADEIKGPGDQMGASCLVSSYV